MGSSQAAMSFLANLARAAFGLGLGATVLNSSLYTVDGGQRAVLFDRFRGVIDETVSEGTHFLVPWLQRPYIFDIRTRPHTFASISGTKDLQMVNLTLRLPYSENIALLLLGNTHSRAPSRKTLLLSSEPLISEPSPRRTT
ncbi:prohibitin-3, mitochondrial-like [Camellia sinensis]|uniref:prohibitin-3, mitochondrial-like n=1 Tax=Camellia sinensis TaxID=4442 RepID=UPI001036D218|nr:prohibitin-3, mitochondrial-like [Camellia sinensis]